jgi:hypothetical protein
MASYRAKPAKSQALAIIISPRLGFIAAHVARITQALWVDFQFSFVLISVMF